MRSTLVAAMMLIVSPASAAPDDLVTRPLVLPAGAIDLQLTAEINIQPKLVGLPTSLAPDAWWGILPRWTIGLIHSNASIDLFEAGATFCVRQSSLVSSTCHRFYHGSGLDVRFSALAGPLAIAPRLRLLIRDLDPIKPAATLGALMRWSHGRFAITSDPYLRLPLANHDLGNRAALVVPLWFAVQPARGWELAVQTGYNADVILLHDDGHIPLSLGVTRRVTADLDLRVEAGWSRLLGQQHDVSREALMIAAGWHPWPGAP